MIHTWRASATWAILGLYLLTGPVVEAVHSEPLCLSSGISSGVAITLPGERNHRSPVDQPHTCIICSQQTERLTTPALQYQLSAIRLVSLLSVPVLTEHPVPARYFSPDKRGPPFARV